MPYFNEYPGRNCTRSHMSHNFPTDGNQWGIPTVPLLRAPVAIPRECVAFSQYQAYGGRFVHFYYDDVRFEKVWNAPSRYLNQLKKASLLATPDFSLYSDWPLAAQIWNVYRSRWCGAYWQEHGISVVPTVSWSTPESYPFAFVGIPTGSIVTVSSVGVAKQPKYRMLFEQGFDMMMRTIKPRRVLWYGSMGFLSENVQPFKFTNYHYRQMENYKGREHHGR